VGLRNCCSIPEKGQEIFLLSKTSKLVLGTNKFSYRMGNSRSLVGPCQHGMARLQVAGGGTASDMEGSCEYFLINSRGQPTSGGPPPWGLGDVLTTPYRKNVSCTNGYTESLGGLIIWLRIGTVGWHL